MVGKGGKVLGKRWKTKKKYCEIAIEKIEKVPTNKQKVREVDECEMGKAEERKGNILDYANKKK